MSPSLARRLSLFLLAASALAIVALTLTPAASSVQPSPWCLTCGDLWGTDFVLNVLLFVPFGLALAGLTGSWRWSVAVPILTSLSIELLQFRVVSGRYASAGDLLSNSLGGLAGAAIGMRAALLALPNARQARHLVMVGGAVIAALLVTSARLLQPSLPFLVYWVQWEPKKNGYDVFSGHLDSLEVNGNRLQAAMAVDPLERPGVIVAERNEVRAVVRARPVSPSRIAPIARMSNMAAEQFMIGQFGNSLVYRARMRAADFGVRLPVAALDDAFSTASTKAGAESPELELEARMEEPGHLLLRARGREGSIDRDVALSPAVAWAFVAPRDVPLQSGFQYANALFLMLLTLPVFYWIAVSAAARSDRTATLHARLKSTVLGASFILCLAIIPEIAGAASFSPIEWGGIVLSAGIGALLSRATRRVRLSTAHLRVPQPEIDFT